MMDEGTEGYHYFHELAQDLMTLTREEMVGKYVRNKRIQHVGV
jgi:hypothetical protein